MTDFGEFSRYFQTDAIIVDGKETIGVWNPPDFIKNEVTEDLVGKFSVTNSVEGRPDLIANQIYGTPKLSWVLIAFNDVRDPLNWPKTGDIIDYPLEQVVFPQVSR